MEDKFYKIGYPVLVACIGSIVVSLTAIFFSMAVEALRLTFTRSWW